MSILCYWISGLDVGIYIVPAIIFFMFLLIISLIPTEIAWRTKTHWEGSRYSRAILKCFLNVLISIFLYAKLYQNSGLIVNQVHSAVDIYTAIYFSGTTWTTVGYGDVLAPEGFRILTTCEAITGYFAMAIIIALGIKAIDSATDEEIEARI